MPTKAPLSAPLQGARILIVEDDFLLATNFQDRLKREGCDVIGLASREEKALAILEKSRPDAVVLDLNLKGKVAIDLAKTLVARQIPFVIVTGYGSHDFELPALQAPRLQKPIKTKELVSALSDLIRSAE